MKYYIIAGEASGDLHASYLMRGLQDCDPDCRFRFWGGDAMAAVGGMPVRHYRDTAVMGIVEVASRLPGILGNLAFCRKDLLAWKPDAVILVDYPGFNLKIARFAKAHGYKVFYYIAPKVWAHKAWRVKRLGRDVDALYCIFPFELDWFRRHGMEPRYFGNPLLDSLPQSASPDAERPSGQGRKIALLPGSRAHELKFLMPRMVALERLVKASPALKDCRLRLAVAPSMKREDYLAYLPEDTSIELVFGRTPEVLCEADAAVISSGTASLEAALLGTPQVVCYGFNALTWQIARRTVKVPYVSLANLTLGRRIFPELLQDAATAEAIFREVERILQDGVTAARMRADYDDLRNALGGPGASGRTAKDMYEEIARL